MNLARAFWQKLQHNGVRTILTGLDPGGQILWQRTRAELLAEASLWMAALRDVGVGPGDRVALSLGTSVALVPAHMAVLGVGAAVVPLNPALAPREAKAVLERAEVRLAITGAETVARSPEMVSALRGPWWIADPRPGGLPQGTTGLAEVLARVQPGPEPSERAADDLALLLFTSGTTGRPKGVGLTHGNLLSNLEMLLARTWGMTEEDRLLHALPPHHLHGLGLGIYGSLFIGNAAVLLERFDAATVLRAIPVHCLSLFMGVPTMYHRLLEVEGETDLSTMRLFISGSAPLSPELFRRFHKRFGFTILERYGLTETAINTSNPVNGPRKPGSVGLPLPGVEIGVFDPQSGVRLKTGEVGEIWVRGPNVCPGYWHDPEATQAAFHQGWFRTGDLGAFDTDGYLAILGRIKELIIVGGTNVTPGEVEVVLEGEPGVVECAVVGVPDPDMGEKVAAFVVARPGEDPGDLETRLRGRAEKELAPYKRPRLYCFTNTLPRNAMGKIERSKLLWRRRSL
jgi:malonyl-CoA/methylmalonyl-CoA synthetase